MPFCTQCGKDLRDGAKFCTQCGAKVRSQRISQSNPSSYSQPAQPRPTTNQKSSFSSPIVFETKKQTSNTEIRPNPVINKETETETESHLESTKNFESNTSLNDFKDLEEEESEIIDDEYDESLEIEDIRSNTEIAISQEDLVKNKLKEQLQRIKYSFKQIDELETYLFRTTFIGGSIKELIWDFTSGFKLSATLPENVNQEVIFNLDLEEDRQIYDWKNPYESVKFTSEIKNESIIKKIKREGRMVEKLSRIRGAVKTAVKGQKIELEISTLLPDNIRLALDAVKEIAWLLDITLK